MSEAAQQVIRKYTEGQGGGQAGRDGALCAATGILPWAAPTAQDHATLLAVPPSLCPPQSADCVDAHIVHGFLMHSVKLLVSCEVLLLALGAHGCCP